MTDDKYPSSWDRLAQTETISSARKRAEKKGKNTPDAIEPSPPKKTTNSFFERMSKTETYATATSKGKYDHSVKKNIETNNTEKKTTNAFFDRMSKTETYATSDMKGKVSPAPESPTNEKPAHNKRTTNAFFDRMSKTETYATSTLKGKVSPTHKIVAWKKQTTNTYGNSPPAPVTPTSKSPPKTVDQSFFDRLSKTETASSAQKKAQYRIESTKN